MATKIAKMRQKGGANIYTGRMSLGMKRLCDLLLSGVGLILSFPVWVISSIAIIMESGGPIFITQKRVGRNGEIFEILKFRSMGKETHNGPMMKSKDDYETHVTKVGEVLRATAMDELPQLLAIFLGHMSFVGPRPFHPEVEIIGSKFDCLENVPDFEKRAMVRPGLTGIAQIYGSKEAKTEHKVKYDLLYLKNQSFWLDARLIFLSFWVTFKGKWEESDRGLG